MNHVEIWNDPRSPGLSWSDASKLLTERVERESSLWRHSIASACVLAELARICSRDVNTWCIAALIHDVDWPQTADCPSRHGSVVSKWLQELNADPILVRAVAAHNDELIPPVARETPFEHLLAAGETSTGLIAATAKIMPDRTVASVTSESLVRRFNTSSFARSVNRATIRECEMGGFNLEEFLSIALRAMQNHEAGMPVLPGIV